MKVYFTSDFHLNHFNIIKYTGRPFKSLDEMNATIIRKFNERVDEDDMCFYLGDFCFKSGSGRGEGEPDKAEAFRKQLKCKNIIFIEGNHDKGGKNSLRTPIKKLIINHGGKDICLVHNPDHIDTNYSFHIVGHCVTPDTEILTLSGWKKYDELTTKDKAASYNLEKNLVEYQSINNIHLYNYKGSLFNFKSTKLDILSTSDHRHVIVPRKQQGNHIKARIKYSYCINQNDSFLLNTLKWDYPILHSFKNKFWAELIGFIIGDGHYEWYKNNLRSVCIRQKEGAKTVYLHKLITKCGLSYTKTNEIPYPRFKIRASQDINKEFLEFLKEEISDKKLNRLLISLPKKELQHLYKGLIQSDGHNYHSYQEFYQKDCSNILFFEELCLRLGYSIHTAKRTHATRIHPKIIYYYTKSKNNRTAFVKKAKKINYNGVVWCPELDNGTWVAKRNGKAFITGNCHDKWMFKRIKKGYSIVDCCNVSVEQFNYYPTDINEIFSAYSKWLKTEKT